MLQRPQRFKLFTTYLINSKWKEEYKDTLETVLVQGHGLNSVTQENFETTKLKCFFFLRYNLTERKILYSYKLSYFIKQRVMDLTIVIPCGYYNSYLLKNLLEPIMDYILVYHWHTLTAASKSSLNEQSSTVSLSPSISRYSFPDSRALPTRTTTNIKRLSPWIHLQSILGHFLSLQNNCFRSLTS